MKDDQQPIVKKDMNIASPAKIYPIPTEVISDGRIVKANLKKLDLTEDWLNQQLIQQSIHSVKDVIFAQVQTDGTLDIYLKSE